MPSLHVPERSRLTSTFKLLPFLFFFTLVFCLVSFASPTLAASPPNPQPCFNPEPTDNLTDNYVTNQDGSAPIQLDVSASGHRGDVVTPRQDFTYPVNFSKLQAIFGAPNSNYTEGRFQDPTHQQTNLLGLDSAPLLNYQGPADKAGEKVITDTFRQKYVKYVYDKNTLGESGNTFTDYNGRNPKTIYDLVTAYGLPIPPRADQDKTVWNKTWGMYWQKIPTAYDEFYIGKLEFRDVAGQDLITKVMNGQFCIVHTVRIIEFSVPNFFRTAATTGGDNITLVPLVAQAPNNDPIGIASSAISNIEAGASNVLKFCFQFAKNTPLAKALQKISKVSLELFTTKNAYADFNSPCIKVIPDGKAGSAPFCALYPTKADGSLNVITTPPPECTNVATSLKLNTETNVDCNFRMTWTGDPIAIGSVGPGAFDSCGPPDINGIITCSIKVYIYPNFRVPFLCQAWNNSTYSDENAACATVNPQQTGRPGSYTFFTPQAAQEKDPVQQMIDDCTASGPIDIAHLSPSCRTLINWVVAHDPGAVTCIQNAMITNPANMVNCLVAVAQANVKSLPGQATNVLGANTESSESGQVLAAGDDGRQRLIGGVDCTKHLSRDVTLKPKVLQDNLGIGYSCDLAASSGGPPPPPPPPPGGGGPPPGLGGDCGGKYTSANAPAGNFGDSACDFSVTNLDALLASLDPANADTWHAIIQLESSFNPNAVAAAVNGTAYGLVQMDSGLNGQYDNGQVPWRTQVSNAINYNNNLKKTASPSGSGTLVWCYWQAAYPPYLNLVTYAQCGL